MRAFKVILGGPNPSKKLRETHVPSRPVTWTLQKGLGLDHFPLNGPLNAFHVSGENIYEWGIPNHKVSPIQEVAMRDGSRTSQKVDHTFIAWNYMIWKSYSFQGPSGYPITPSVVQ